MAYYTPCNGCALDKGNCQRRNEVKSAIAGLSVTCVNFQCKLRRPLFISGDRVSFKWTHYDQSGADYYGEIEPDELTLAGTVAKESGRRGWFIVKVDQSPVPSGIECDLFYEPKDIFRNGGFAVKVNGSAMCLSGEARKAICTDCLGYDVTERCWRTEYCRPPNSALCVQKAPQ